MELAASKREWQEVVPDDVVDARRQHVVDVVCGIWSVSPLRVLNRDRSNARAREARNVAFFVFERMDISRPKIAEMFGSVHRGTVGNGIARVEWTLRNKPREAEMIREACAACGVPVVRPEPCGEFVAIVIGDRMADWIEEMQRGADLCARPGCGARRTRHHE